MKLSKDFWDRIAYTLVQTRGGSDEARKEAQEQGDEGLATWAFLNMAQTDMAKATLAVLFSRDVETLLTKLTDAIDRFNADSGKLTTAYVRLTWAIAVATILNTCIAAVLAWQALHR